MKRFVQVVVLGLFMVSCDFAGGNQKQDVPAKKEYDLYQPSEMASYMNVIYDLNETLKKDIEAGIIPQEFPEEILNIHSAQMSNGKDRNTTFESFSHLFVERVQILFDTTATTPLKDRYNDVINLCLSCHQTQCPGPIPRIQKLLITRE